MQWSKFRKLVERTVESLRAADGDREKIESTIRHYLTRGRALGMSPMILWDYFTISSPGIPERAGYDAYEAEQVVALFEQLSNELFGNK